MRRPRPPAPAPAEAPAPEERAALLAWFDAHQRADLPWREGPAGARDPWRVWVSEVMLQQTRAQSVAEYLPRFLARFPTPRALAEAPWEDVSSAWAGLGYYSRARNLQAATAELLARHGGEVPRDPEAFGALKGVGPYTRGAVMSISFDLPEPIVDGNVARVFARRYGVGDEVRSRPAQERLWALARGWAAGARPGALNEALMELGATLCAPSSPSCHACPLAAGCVARREGRQGSLPLIERARGALPVTVWLAALSREEGAREEGTRAGVWVTRRDPEGGGLLSGLWGLPAAEWAGGEEALAEELARAAERRREPRGERGGEEQLDLFSALEPPPALPAHAPDRCADLSAARAHLAAARGLRGVGALVAHIEHRFTHRLWRLYVFEAEGAPELAEGEDRRAALSPEELEGVGLGGPSLKALRAAGVPLRARRGAGAR